MFKKLKSAFYTSVIGANLVQRLKLFCVDIVFPLKRTIGIKKELVISVKIRHNNKICTVYLTDVSDMGVLREIFIEEQYKNIKMIYDKSKHKLLPSKLSKDIRNIEKLGKVMFAKIKDT